MWNYAFVFFVISKTYKIYDINLSLRKLKNRMTKVIRFLCANRSLESLDHREKYVSKHIS